MKKRFTEEQIIGILKEQESGERTADVCPTGTWYRIILGGQTHRIGDKLSLMAGAFVWLQNENLYVTLGELGNTGPLRKLHHKIE